MKRSTTALTILSFLFLVPAFLLGDALGQSVRGAGVPFDALPEELRALNPKDSFVPCSQKRVGTIHTLEGKVLVIHKADKQAFFGAEGDPIFENDSLNTLANARCRIRMLDDDVITMAPDSEFSIDSFLDQREEGKKSSLFSMAKGKAMFYALRLFRYKETRFNVNTPTLTVGVRGTKFGVEILWKDEKTAQAGVMVADATNQIGPYLAQMPPGGGGSFTNAFCEDGYLLAGGLTIPPGQMYNGLTGMVIPTPPGVLRGFYQATGMGGAGGGTTGGAGAGEGEGGAGGTLQPGQGTFADLSSDIANQTSVQTGTQTETSAAPPPVQRPTAHQGYFTALLTYVPSPSLQDIYITKTPQDFDGGYVQGYGIVDTGNYIKGKGQFGGGPAVTEAYIWTYTSTFNDPISHTELGYNAYQEWGYWTTEQAFNVGGTNVTVDNRSYYISGERTSDTAMAALKSAGGTYNYSGNAWGTFWKNPGGVNMTGTFSTAVNFNSATLSDFGLNLSGSGYSASITNAGGSFDTGKSSFSLSGGTWTMQNAAGTNYTPNYQAASGSLYGPDGKYIGGVGGMKKTPDGVGVNFMFQGNK